MHRPPDAVAAADKSIRVMYGSPETEIRESPEVISVNPSSSVLYAGRMQSGRYSFGDGDEMSVIASVVLGGASMAGGSGSMIGALAGSILMGMISNALILANLSSAQQKMVNGFIIIAAVALSNLAQRKKSN